jgi:hypothetical protein
MRITPYGNRKEAAGESEVKVADLAERSKSPHGPGTPEDNLWQEGYQAGFKDAQAMQEAPLVEKSIPALQFAKNKAEIKVAGFGDEPAYSYEGPGYQAPDGPGFDEPDAPGKPEPGPGGGYSLMLTDAEVETLAWLADRGYFPGELYDAMDPAEGEPEEVPRDIERRWVFPEHAAWSLTQLQEDDPDAYLANLGDPLLGKILELEQKIV